MLKKRSVRLLPVVLAAGAVGLVAVSAIGADKAADKGAYKPGNAVTRRLTSDQYRAIIADVFGDAVKLGGRFEPDLRQDGLIEVGTGHVSVSSDGMEQYDIMARTIADQVVAPVQRGISVACKPKSETAADEACARKFVSDVGPLLYRRPLTKSEEDIAVAMASESANKLGSFYTGLSWSLAAMLESPQFLFRTQTTEPDPAMRGQVRLDAYSKASQLSFFLWNAGPDDLLLDAARKGELNNPKGLARQVDRMMASPRMKDGLRAFFSDMLHFDEIASLVKDPLIYPKFNSKVAEDAKEQTLRTVLDVVLTRNGDYRDVFTTKKTFMSQTLAAVYKVPLVNNVPNGSPDTWQPFEFASDDPRGGILMQASFVSLNSHPGRSSPTLRGKALREVILCQRVPPPPGDVKFDIVQDTSNPTYRTARARLEAHRTNPVCAGCHKLIDPMGLALENFDGSGGYRTNENGVPIDTSGELDGVKFSDAAGLGRTIHDNPAATSCLVDRISAYALGRVPAKTEDTWVQDLKAGFSKDGYKVPALIRRIALSPEFYRVAAPDTAVPGKSNVKSTMLSNPTESPAEVTK